MSAVQTSAARPDTLLADQLCAVVETLQRSTVHVRSGRGGAGSGVIWRPDGLIVTNAHVAWSSEATVELWDGRVLDAEVVSRDRGRDLASLIVEANDLPAAPVGDSDRLRVGQLVAAVGNPLGVAGALTIGIVHAIAAAEGRGRQRWVQADVRLAPGNSGGPLADIEGRVIGINSMVAGGLGLAVPSNSVAEFLGVGSRQLYLGLTVQPVTLPRKGGVTAGLLVLAVASGSPAEAAGLLIGDVLIEVNGEPFSATTDLAAILAAAETGSALDLELVRAGSRITRAVAPREAQPGGDVNREAA